MKTNKFTAIASCICAVLCATTVNAAETIEFDNGLKLDWGLTLGYTIGARVEGRSSLFSGKDPAGRNDIYNDGNNNFDKGSLIANRISALGSVKLSKGNSGFVLSGTALYDDVYNRSNDNSADKSFLSTRQAPENFNQFTKEARKLHGQDRKILDAYFYTNFNLGKEGRANVKLGRHVVSWGESLFFPNVSMAQAPFDGSKANLPGAQIKDIILPEDQISMSYSVNSDWTILANYQYDWHPVVVDAPGSYLARADNVGAGAHCLEKYDNAEAACRVTKDPSDVNGGKRGGDIKPKKSGQFGLGVRYRASLDTEYGLYYVKYHSRIPLPLITYNFVGPARYNLKYQPDVELLGASFTTSLGEYVVSGEATYRHGAPVVVGGDKTTFIGESPENKTYNSSTADIFQLNLNTFANFGRTKIAPQSIFLGELSYVNVSRVQKVAFPKEGFGANLNSGKLAMHTKNSLAFQGLLMLMYPGIAGGWDLTVPIGYAHQLSGRNGFSNLGAVGDKRLSLGAVFTKESWELRADYMRFMGKPSSDDFGSRVLTDRDFVTLGAKYTF